MAVAESWYRVEGINPEPWTAPTAGVIMRGGKHIPVLTQSGTLRSYQEAFKEEFASQNGEVPVTTDDMELWFYFWRRMDTYEGATRKVHANVADATNLQKATEDALHNLIFENDRQVKDVTSRIVEQSEDTEPLIMIYVRPLQPVDPWVLELAERTRTGSPMTSIGRRNFRKIEDAF